MHTVFELGIWNIVKFFVNGARELTKLVYVYMINTQASFNHGIDFVSVAVLFANLAYFETTLSLVSAASALCNVLARSIFVTLLKLAAVIHPQSQFP